MVKFPHSPILHYAFNFLDRENSDKKNTLPLRKQTCCVIFLVFFFKLKNHIFLFLLKKNNIYVSVQWVVCWSHQSDRLGYISRTNQIAALGYVSRTNQSVVFVLWFERCSNFNEVMGDSERAVRKWNHLLEWEMLAFLCFKRVFYRAFWEMPYYWTDKRYQITYGKRVTRAVKMVDSCVR